MIQFYNNECIVYLDFLKKQDVGVYNAYVDFRQTKDLKLFIQSNEHNQNFGEINTYLELCKVKTNKRLRSGCYYKLNLSLINNISFIQNQESLFIGRTYNCEKMPTPSTETEELLQSHEPLDQKELIHIIHNTPEPNDLMIQGLSNVDLTLNVRDVNQANWNEILKGDIIKLVYDIGAKNDAKKDEVRAIFEFRREILKRDKPILIISHWDMDHIHCLRYADQQTIKDCFSKFICIDVMRSVTSHNVYNKVRTALGDKNVFCIQPAYRTNGITMHLWKRVGNVSIYRGEKSTNINYCGLCIFVKGIQKSVNFTGDVRLIQAKNIYDQELQQNLITKKHVLIAPHHGGENITKHRVYSNPTTEVVISVGAKNIYGHPSRNMLSYLLSLCNHNLYRTDINGDVNISI